MDAGLLMIRDALSDGHSDAPIGVYLDRLMKEVGEHEAKGELVRRAFLAGMLDVVKKLTDVYVDETWRIADKGENLSGDVGNVIVVDTVAVDGKTGGTIVAVGNATIHAENQSGGACLALDNATIHTANQSGGFCRAFGNATIHATNQQGGECLALDNATIHTTNQQGGACWAWDNATIHAKNQQGGDCRALDNAKIIRVD